MPVLARQCYELSDYTTPGEYAYLYATLPTGLTELCHLIKQQFIHPGSLKRFRDVLPANRANEDGRFATVERMLQGLLERNPAGLVNERSPEQRLIVSCRHHALFLASILKSRGVPARVRVGFAQYVADQPQKHVDHWICEVWNDAEERWMFVDPDMKMVDFPRAEFELAGDVWLRARAGEVEPYGYGSFPRWGLSSIRDNLCHDFESVLNHESNYREGPPLFHASFNALQPTQLVLLDFMAEWLQQPDANYDQLIRLRDERPELRR
ncbi:hypothetical protein IAD21_03465 [Abditibacteriota bacterium]|nr:hypothetical protein IAD21_03465 [Abditibacteriota bacterium]